MGGLRSGVRRIPIPKGEPYRPGDVVAVPAETEAGVDEDEEFRDPYGVASEGRHSDQISSQVRYVLEGIVVIGNKRTKAHTFESSFHLKRATSWIRSQPDWWQPSGG